MSKRRPAFAQYLLDLRGERYSLRDVERLSGGAVSNVYLSQLETGLRSDPNPRILVALAHLYEVPVAEMFEKAGYVDEPAESDVEIAFRQVLADPNFKFGTRYKGKYDETAKRFIIELYERATKKRLL